VSAVGVGFLQDFTATFDWRAHRLWLRSATRLGDGSIETYGYLPQLRRHQIVAGSVLRNGPAEAVGLAVGDALPSAGGRSLANPTHGVFCAAYAAAFSPLRDRHRIVFEHRGERRSAELLAVDLGPGRLARPPRAPAGPRARAIPERERNLFVDGDSLAVGMLPFLPAALPGWQISSSAETGRHTAFGVAKLRERADALPRFVVISLGTNDDSRDTEGFRGGVSEALSIAGDKRCVVWLNVARPPFAGTSYAGINGVLDEEAVAHSNLVVIDWATSVHAHPGWLAPDGVHLTAEGYRARALETARAIRKCA
jgi:lysophospholipase L1-like esterase